MSDPYPGTAAYWEKRYDEAQARIRELEAALRKLIKGYVNTLESGAIAIQAYGGKCDLVEVMEAGDPHLIEAKAVLASASETGTESMQREVAGGHAGARSKIDPEGVVRLHDRCPKCGEELQADGHHFPDPEPFI